MVYKTILIIILLNSVLTERCNKDHHCDALHFCNKEQYC